MASAPRRPAPRRNPSRAGAASGDASRERSGAASKPLGDAEIRDLQALLDRVPAPLDPLDVSMVDGFLCGVLVQPRPVPTARWMKHITDVDGRPLPASFDATRLHALVLRRHAELAAAIGKHRWFHPWVFELSGDAPDADDDSDADAADEVDDLEAAGDAESQAQSEAASEAALPWVAGIVTAFELFPDLTRLPSASTLEPLSLLYRHLDPDDLEDADELLAEIETLEPVADLAEAVEGLVRATLLLADAARERE